VKVLLADDHGLFRDSMAVWLKQLRDDVIIDFASNYQGVYEHLANSRFDLLLLDLGMEDMEGSISIRKLIKQAADLPIVVVSADENPETVMGCINAGASGYVTKSSSGETILNAINQVLNGAKYIPADMSFPELPKLTERQQDILKCLIDGDSNKTIADKLFLSEGTVKQYISKLLSDLDVDNRVQAANKARKLLGIGGS